MKLAKGIIIPVLANNVLSPEVHYSEHLSGIYFETEDDQFGRITFDNLDAIKVCRGEYLPCDDDWEVEQDLPWVYKVENSKWLNERYGYEREYYGTAYEFGGNVDEMLTYFHHYIFKFHDEFVEAIARGFWFEKDTTSLFNKELMDGHPLLPLPETLMKIFEIEGIKCKAIFNQASTEELIQNTLFCQQPLIDFAVEFDGKFSLDWRLIIMQRQNKIMSRLIAGFGSTEFEKDGVATFEDVKPLIEKHIREIAERRQQMRK